MMTPLRPGVVRSLSKRLSYTPEPLALFRALTDEGRRANTTLLESAEPTSRKTQRSVLVLSSALSIVCRGQDVTLTALNSNGNGLLPFLLTQLAVFSPVLNDARICLRVPETAGHASESERLQADSTLSVLRIIAASLEAETANLPEAVFLTGLFAYDLVAQFEALPEPESGASVPDYSFLLADQLIVVDHLKQHAHVVVNVFGGDAASANYYSALDAITHISDVARDLVRVEEAPAIYPAISIEQLRRQVSVDCSDTDYEATVLAMKRHIVAGDVFQIVPSRTFSIPCADPMAAYASLKALNPSPYLFYTNTGEFVLFGASPESAVKVDGATRTVDISPIAGTRPRGLRADGSIDPDLDSRYEAELRLDGKENAEHMMLVDLARNDVARVSKPGARHVADLLRVDRYSHVMHLVSRVRGELRDGLDALHAYQASMNMGTLTGAPKIRAMQLLREHEAGRRGYYGGAIGYLRGDGSFDTAIVIRSALVQDGMAYVRAGAGVVHDSIPSAEADETRRKAEAVLRAIARVNAVRAVEQCHVA